MIRAIFFDFDGVILDSVHLKTSAFSALAAPHGEDARQKIVAYHKANGGVSRFRKFEWFYNQVLGKEITPQELDELGMQFEKLVFDAVLKAPEIPGALDFLEKHHSRYKMFVISGTPEEELKKIVQLRGLEKYFLGVFGSPSTKAEIAKKILTDHQLHPKDVAFVGDAMTDYHAAEKSGLHFIGIVESASPFPPSTRTMANLRNLNDCLGQIP